MINSPYAALPAQGRDCVNSILNWRQYREILRDDFPEVFQQVKRKLVDRSFEETQFERIEQCDAVLAELREKVL